MGLRSVSIGYAENKINQSAISQINKGNNLTRPSEIEYEAAKKLVNLIKFYFVKMINFGLSYDWNNLDQLNFIPQKDYIILSFMVLFCFFCVIS